MSLHRPSFFAYVLFSVVSLTASVDAVEVQEVAGGGYSIEGATYTAAVDGQGNLTSLTSGGAEFLGVVRGKTGGAFPHEKGAETVKLHGHTVAARRGDVRVEYTFHDHRIGVIQEGGAVRFYLSDQINSAVTKSGQTVAHEDAARIRATDVIKLVAAGQAIGITEPMHVGYREMLNSRLTRGGKATDLVEYEIQTGLSPAITESIANFKVEPNDTAPRMTPQWGLGKPAAFTIALDNLIAKPQKLALAYKVLNHYSKGDAVAQGRKSIEVPAGEKTTVDLSIPLTQPGPMWLHVELAQNDEVIRRAVVPFVYALEQFSPPSTRPPDFKTFWDAQLEAMRRIPPAPVLTPRPDVSGDGWQVWDLKINDPDGKPLETWIAVADGEGKKIATVSGRLVSQPIEMLMKIVRGDNQPGAPKIVLNMPMPRDATYTYWNGRADNNLIENYLLAIRLMDYLRTREDVKGLYLMGGSRSGPVVVAAAALSPDKVLAVNSHLPTSAGISWNDRPYVGWGRAPSDLANAAYVDPVNFAPDMSVPFLLTVGSLDTLAPIPGWIAFYNQAGNAPWKKIGIAQVNHGGWPWRKRFALIEDLAKASGIQAAVDAGEADILKKH